MNLQKMNNTNYYQDLLIIENLMHNVLRLKSFNL